MPVRELHPPFCTDDPNEPHLDLDGDCTCLGDCCNTNELCTCPECGGGCGDHPTRLESA